MRIAVIGAGWAGCAAAVDLTQRGHAVTVFEAGAVPGGRARRVLRSGLPLDNGQHLLLGAYEATRRALAIVHRAEVPPRVLDRRPLAIHPLAPGRDVLAFRSRGTGPLGLALGLLSARGLRIGERLQLVAWFTRLAHAGFRSQRAAPLYLGSRFFGIVIGIGAFALFSEIKGLGQTFAFGSIGALVGYYAPHYYIKRRINKRFTGIRKELPDVLDTIITCVEAGLGLNAAMDRVADERMRVRGDVMGGELKYMTYEMQAGIPREVAFHNLGERNGVDDLQSLAAFMVQSEKLGTGLTEALRIYAAELRTRRRQRAQEQANKAAVKLLFPLVFFIFPTMFLVILGPAMMKFQSSFGSIANK